MYPFYTLEHRGELCIRLSNRNEIDGRWSGRSEHEITKLTTTLSLLRQPICYIIMEKQYWGWLAACRIVIMSCTQLTYLPFSMGKQNYLYIAICSMFYNGKFPSSLTVQVNLFFDAYFICSKDIISVNNQRLTCCKSWNGRMDFSHNFQWNQLITDNSKIISFCLKTCCSVVKTYLKLSDRW